MPVAEVYAALSSNIQTDAAGTFIDLWGAAQKEAALKGLIPVLGLFGIGSSYVVRVPQLVQGASSVTLSASGEFNQPGATAPANIFPVTAQLAYSANGDIFALSLRFAGSGWGFSDFFLVLPQTMMVPDPDKGRGIRWCPSFLNDVRISSPVFSARSGEGEMLNLTGFLPEPANPVITRNLGLMAPWPLRVSGTLTMPKDAEDFPRMNLNAAAGNPNAGITGDPVADVKGPSAITLNGLSLGIISAPLDPVNWGVDAFTSLTMRGNLALGEITGVISTLVLSLDSTWSFSIQFAKETTLVTGLNQLQSLFGVELPIPMNFPVLSWFYISDIDIDLRNGAPSGENPSFSLNGFAITIRSTQPWKPPVPFVTFEDVGTRWVWTWTTIDNRETGVSEKTYVITGSVFGSITFGGSGDGGELPLLPPPFPPGGAGGVHGVIASAGEQRDAPARASRNVMTPDAAPAAVEPVTIDVSLSIPDFFISGAMRDGDCIPIGKALEYFFGSSVLPRGLLKANVNQLRFSADPIGQNYYGSASILFGDPKSPAPRQGWEINLIVITIILQQLDFYVNVNSGKVSGGVSGTLFIDQEDPGDYKLPRLLLSADYPAQDPDTPTGWALRGYLYPGTSIDLVKLVKKFLGLNPSDTSASSFALLVAALDARFTTGTQAYELAGTISARWTPGIFGTELKISASASAAIRKDDGPDATARGTLAGFFAVNKISVLAMMDLGVREPTYLFKVQFDNLWIQAATSWRGDKEHRHQVVSIQLGGITLGDILEYLVNLAAPTLGFRLDPPWNILKSIDLSRFVLVLDPQDNIVEFLYNADVDLGVMRLDAIGIRYTRAREKGGSGAVNLILTGNFLGKSYDSSDPLSWDVINDPPPDVSGQGKSLVDLRYLGVGQRVTFAKPTPDTVAESVALLRDSMKPYPKDSTRNPLVGTDMKYSGDSQWLVGLDVSLMQMIDLGFIFNDPKLYGLSIALKGEKSGSLAGLRFEILYKKITNDVGMFRIELRVPDAFRTFQIGVASVTLGIVVIEIYTNGNFMLDLGFPYNRNYDRSFSLQAGIFIGRGGFYFGVLNGDTSSRVPKITNGNFSPVIELGIGIAAGIGREVRAGILSGGAYIEIEVIFQGVLAWFNPTSSAVAPAEYFWCQGMVALHGKVYGCVDFCVVSVSITLEAYAQVSVIYESYEPMYLSFIVAVKAEASIKILFIRIHFHFGVSLSFDLTVGSASPTPWILADSQGNTAVGRSPATLAGNFRPDRAKRLFALRQHHQRLMVRAALRANAPLADDSGYLLDWKPKNPVFDEVKSIALTMLPLFSVGNLPISWTADPPANPAPEYRAAFLLYADTGISPQAVTASHCVKRSGALSGMTTGEATDGLPADLLVKGLLLYALYAIPQGPGSVDDNVTAGQLAFLAAQMEMKETSITGFSKDSLFDFCSTNLKFLISGDPGSGTAEKSAMIFPIPPYLNWDAGTYGKVNFSEKNLIGAEYEAMVRRKLAPYAPVEGKGESSGETATESFACFLYRDFFRMVTQSAVQEAAKQLQDVAITVKPIEEGSATGQPFEDAAKQYASVTLDYTIHAGDTVESIAATLGGTAAELLFLNPNLPDTLQHSTPGTVIEVILGISPEILAQDNPDTPFVKGAWELGVVSRQVAGGDTLQSIADLFHAELSVILGYSVPGPVPVSREPNLLQAGAAFNLGPVLFVSQAGCVMDQRRAAGIFYARYVNPDLQTASEAPDMQGWYAQAVTLLNAATLTDLFPDGNIPENVELIPGKALYVPNSYNANYFLYDEQGNPVINPDATNTYTTVAGDTLHRIGTALTLSQDYPTSNPAAAPDWQSFMQGVSQSGANWSIPARNGIAVEVGETLESLVRRLVVDSSYDGVWSYNWGSVATWAGGAPILALFGIVTVPDAKTADSVFTFNELSRIYGISIAEAAGRLRKASIFAAGTRLSVRLAPAGKVSDIIDGILTGESFANIVNQASRMMLAGLQLPGTDTAAGDTSYPLYDLTGQQFTVNVDPRDLPATALTLSVGVNPEPLCGWIQLMNSVAVTEDATLTGLLDLHGDGVTAHNPGAGRNEDLRPGMVLLTGPAASGVLTFSYTGNDIVKAGPAGTGLAVTPWAGVAPAPPNPTPMPLSGSIPRTYGLDHQVSLQTSAPLSIPVKGSAVLSGNPSLWPFPQAFRNVALSGSTTPYEVLRATQGEHAARHANAVTDCTYGCRIPFRIRRLDDEGKRFNLVGVDTDQRALLLTVRKWILDNPSPPAPNQGYLLLAPAPNASDSSGLVVLPLDAAQTWIVKTNLSTESVPPTNLAKGIGTEIDFSEYFSDFKDLAHFLLLLWEGSVVGGFGFYFGVGQAIPGSAFDDQGNVTLNLLFIAGTQQGMETSGRPPLSFNTCLLTAPGLDPAVDSLCLECCDDSDMITQAVVPPGNLGFHLATVRPPQDFDPRTDKKDLARSLFSLMSFEVEKNASSPFAAPPSGMPVPSAPWDGQGLALWERERLLRREKEATGSMPRVNDAVASYWKFEQVMPVANFAPASLAPDVPGLPDASKDPYRGVGGQDPSAGLPVAHFLFGFGDVLGNRTAPPASGEGVLALKAGYTDPLVGVGEWPAISTLYGVRKPDGGEPQVILQIIPRPSCFLPSPSQIGDTGKEPATRSAEKYAQSYYQLVQENIDCFLVTSLKVAPDRSGANSGITIPDTAPFRRFAAAGYLHARAAAQLEAASPAGSATLEEMIRNYNVRTVEIALANEDRFVADCFDNPGDLKVPAYYPFVENDTMDEYYAAVPETWPKPGSGKALLLLPENVILPLRKGIPLKVNQVSIPTGSLPTPSLAQLAAANNTTPLLLAGENPAASLSPGFVFTMEIGEGGVATVTADATAINTLEKVALAFQSQGVNISAAEAASLNADAIQPGTGGMFAPSRNLSSSFYIVRDGETLEKNGTNNSVTDLANNNASVTRNLFDSGATIYLGDFPGVTVEPLTTLKQLADHFATPLELLLEANLRATLKPTSADRVTGIVVPGAFAWPRTTNLLRIPYAVQSNDTLATAAKRFSPFPGDGSPSATPLALADANREMPRTLLPGKTISVTVGATSYTITTGETGDSFQSAFLKLQAVAPAAQFSDLVNAIGQTANLLNPGVLLVTPPALLSALSSPSDLETAYGIEPGLTALANTGTQGLIADGVSLVYPLGNGKTAAITTRTGDTFNTLLVRLFADYGVQADAGQLAAVNQDRQFLKKGALLLLPPAPIRLPIDIGGSGPYPAPIFPLEVSLRITRPAGLVADEFKTSSQVSVVETAIPAPPRQSGTGSTASRTFDDFVAEFEKALPDLRLASGKITGSTSDLWCVDFQTKTPDPSGIASVVFYGGTAAGLPRFFALKPLYSHLVSRPGVLICALKDDGIMDTEHPVPVNYQGIDVELWAERFLADFDRFLSGPYASAIYSKHPASRDNLDAIITAKKELIPGIAAGLASVLDVQDTELAAGQDAAKNTLQQQLGVNLLKAYETSVAIQYDVKVDSAWQNRGATLRPANLYGVPELESGDASSSVSIVASKAALDQAHSYLTLLTTVSNPSRHLNVSGNLGYPVSNLEFGIVTGEEGYPDSEWLTFFPLQKGAEKPAALRKTDPGNVTMPIPLRVFPSLPVVKGQSAIASDPEGKELGKLSLWNYELTYTAEHAAQDQVFITAEFNLRQTESPLSVLAAKDLFPPLAQYVTVADKLWTLLNGLVDPASKTTSIQIENAVTTFRDLAGNIAANWSYSSGQQAHARNGDNLKADITCICESRVNYDSRGEFIESFTLVCADQPGPDGTWPDVSCSGFELVPSPVPGDPKTMNYVPKEGVRIPALAWPTFTLRWKELNVSSVQNGRAKMWVERNQNLMGGLNIPTAGEFLFKTDEVTAPGVVTPLLVFSNRVEIVPPPGASGLEAALRNALDLLFPEAGRIAGQMATFGVFFGYELKANPQEPALNLTSIVPIALYPDQPLNDDLATQLAQAVEKWKGRIKPGSEGVGWVFSLILYSAMETAKRPLLSIDQLYYREGSRK